MATTSLILVFAASAIWTLSLLANRILGYRELSGTSGNYRVRPDIRKLKRSLFALGLAGLAMAFSPITVNLKTPAAPNKEVAFALDVSRSMDAVDEGEDVSRLERAKTFIVGIVRKHPENTYSLTVFSGESSEAIPKTRDADAFVSLLSGITSRYSNSVGTDFLAVGRALDERFKLRGDKPSGPSALAVILTDGGDAEDTPGVPSLRSVFQHTDQTLKTLTVTFGSPKGAPVPLGKDFMGGTVFQTDESGSPVITKSNRETGRRMADATDGNEADEASAGKAFEKSLSKVLSSDDDPDIRNSSIPVSPFHFISLLAFVAALTIPDKMPTGSKKRSS